MLYPKAVYRKPATVAVSNRPERSSRIVIFHTKCTINETCSLNPTTQEPFCETLDCAERPASPQHAEPLCYVDSKVGSVANFQCKSYVEFPQGRGVAVCTAQGEWNWTEEINCTVPRDCLELLEQHGIRESGPHYISPDNRIVVRAFCDMESDGGGWTVVQRRNSSDVNFTRGWKEYKDGFGEATGNYWIGNNILHALTKGDTTLRIHMMNFSGTTYDAIYKNFRVGDEESKYNMTYDCFVEVNSSAVDAFGNTSQSSFSAKNMPFSTFDNDTKEGCANKQKGGWWYNICSLSNLNGNYCEEGQHCMTWSISVEHLFGHSETMLSIRRMSEQPSCD
uniref:Fibrinogen-like protein A n=1 Tax=Crassostrea virginica TaxID=6565 RepID=A0A8B8CLH6_CRAVI|nr:fibrinogen-like protein A [Crassostrea virginica]